MTQMRDLGVVAFFGSDSNCHTEARLASAWNLPLISHVSYLYTVSHSRSVRDRGWRMRLESVIPSHFSTGTGTVDVKHVSGGGYSCYKITPSRELYMSIKVLFFCCCIFPHIFLFDKSGTIFTRFKAPFSLFSIEFLTEVAFT